MKNWNLWYANTRFHSYSHASIQLDLVICLGQTNFIAKLWVALLPERVTWNFCTVPIVHYTIYIHCRSRTWGLFNSTVQYFLALYLGGNLILIKSDWSGESSVPIFRSFLFEEIKLVLYLYFFPFFLRKISCCLRQSCSLKSKSSNVMIIRYSTCIQGNMTVSFGHQSDIWRRCKKPWFPWKRLALL